jgi:hypothetical protein
MPDTLRHSAPVWTIRSIAIRSRDGPPRLAQVYRRLLAAPSRAGPDPDNDGAPVEPSMPEGR